MVGRRDVMGASLLAGVASLMPPGAAAARQRESADGDVAKAIDNLREAIEHQGDACSLGPCGTIAQIRLQQRNFMKANRKFPDFIDAGIDAWEAVYDWHVKNRQAVNATRLPDGRYGIAFMFTTIVLREDQLPGFVGWGYDGR